MKHNNKVTIDLILPDESIVLFEQQNNTTKKEIRGKLRIFAKEPIRLSEIKVYFKSTIRLHWKEDHSSSSGLLGYRKTMKASRTTRKAKQLLSCPTQLPAGVTDIHFNMYLPSLICPSLKSDFCTIEHTMCAKIRFSSKLLKSLRIDTPVQVYKTVIPDCISAYSTLPIHVVKGEKPKVLNWAFDIPAWFNLHGCIEFKGRFHCMSKHIILDKIKVQVVQEELYFYDISCTDFKKRLLESTNRPLVYHKPPMDTDISFSLPLSALPRSEEQVTTKFNCTLDSPFSRIRHFVMVSLYLDRSTSICVGLPIHLTPEIDTVILDDLPSYQSIETENPPKYSSSCY